MVFFKITHYLGVQSTAVDGLQSKANSDWLDRMHVHQSVAFSNFKANFVLARRDK